MTILEQYAFANQGRRDSRSVIIHAETMYRFIWIPVAIVAFYYHNNGTHIHGFTKRDTVTTRATTSTLVYSMMGKRPLICHQAVHSTDICGW